MPKITVGHQTFTNHFSYMSDHLFILSDKMFERKRNSSVAFGSEAKKQQVTVSTFERWQKSMIKTSDSDVVECEKDSENRSLVSTLWCHVCCQYEHKICSMKNSSNAWIMVLKTNEQPMCWNMQQASNIKLL